MTKLEIDQYELNKAINAIQEFIHLIVNGIEVIQDEHGNNSVRIIDLKTKEVIRELEPDELMAIVDNCKTLMSLTRHPLWSLYWLNMSVELAQLHLNRGRNEVAFEIFMDLAQNELNADANYALTKMCWDGKLTTDQIELFYDFQNISSSLGNGYAIFNIGLIHEKGLGKIKQDYKTAVQYYEKAIKEEVHDAYCNLGSIYLLGTGMEQGVARNVERGVELLTKGAEEGSRQCAYTLGSLYGKGEFIAQDLYKAFYFLTLAALAKHDQAHRVLHIFQHAYKGNYVQEFDAAEERYLRIQNMRRTYRCI